MRETKGRADGGEVQRLIRDEARRAERRRILGLQERRCHD